MKRIITAHSTQLIYARVFFCLLIFLITSPTFSFGLTTDRGRPFGEGQILGYPGEEYFAGDLAHELRVEEPFSIGESFGRWSSRSLTRVNAFSLDPPSLLVFEGIACSIPSAPFVMGILPTGFGAVEFHDFPASAWWGPGAGQGAIQLSAPRFDPDEHSIAGAWGGVPHRGHTAFKYQGYDATFSGSVRHKIDEGITPEKMAWSTAGRFRQRTGSDLRIQEGFLDLRTLQGDRWTVVYGEARIGSGPFNEWMFKPYIQRAQVSGIEVREIGTEIRSLFNMAGFLESQLAVGGSYSDRRGDGLDVGRVRGFVQNTETFDALGIVMADMALRVDLLSKDHPSFSHVMGLQGHYGPAGLYLSSEGAGSSAIRSANRQQQAGLKFRPGDHLDLGIHLTEGNADRLDDFHGPGAILRWMGFNLMPYGLTRELAISIESQWIKSTRMGEVKEVAGRVSVLMGSSLRISCLGRTFKGFTPDWQWDLSKDIAEGWTLDFSWFKPSGDAIDAETWSAGARFEW